ncbi:MAG: hypothetical protein Q9179_004807 [Wetmoreana sp. 5 TL-2023]
MAPVRESIYFPPLDRCLDGRHELLSWRTTYIGLKQLESAAADDSLEKHLTDSQTLDILKRSFYPDSPPTNESKSSFETKTSAINVVPSALGRYDIKQIQDDTLWLSAEAKINEVAALRIVVLERQTRPAAQLQESSLTDNAPLGGSSLNGSRFQPALSASRSALLSKPTNNDVTATEPWESNDARRTRLFHILLAERRYRIKTCRYLIITALCSSGDGRARANQGLASVPAWVEKVGHEILTTWEVYGVSRLSGKNIFIDGVDAVRSRIRGLEEGSGWFQDRGLQESIEAVWCESQILEMVAVLETMLAMFIGLTQLSRSDVVLSWYRLMSDYGFFEVFKPVSEVTLTTRHPIDKSSHFRISMIPMNYSFSPSRLSSPLRSSEYPMLYIQSTRFLPQQPLRKSPWVGQRTY